MFWFQGGLFILLGVIQLIFMFSEYLELFLKHIVSEC